MRIERGLRPWGNNDMGLRGSRNVIRMSEGPLQDAMNDKVGISPNGRSEMSVFVEAEREMAERLCGVAGLFEGTQHEVGDDALFRFADDLFDEALIVLWRDMQVGA